MDGPPSKAKAHGWVALDGFPNMIAFKTKTP